MNSTALAKRITVSEKDCHAARAQAIPYSLSPDVIILTSLIMAINIPLVVGQVNYRLMFFPDAVLLGQLWRLITYPFVHLSWYHLCLDGIAFLLLYTGLEEKNVRRKLLFMAVCGTTSLLAAVCSGPIIAEIGLCGLSGIAHGLMAISGLEMIYSKNNGTVGIVLFLVVVMKSIFEAVTGTVFFDFLHLGMCGTPLAACHAGGVVGGIVCFVALVALNAQR